MRHQNQAGSSELHTRRDRDGHSKKNTQHRLYRYFENIDELHEKHWRDIPHFLKVNPILYMLIYLTK